MKAVLISIQPKWCELIASGKKTIEVRKTRPKMETPFKCYIYCTKGKVFLYKNPNNGELFLDNNGGYRGGDYEDRYLTGKVIGEFVCDRVNEYTFSNLEAEYRINDIDIAKTCLNHPELIEYGKGKPLYGWHISELKIYDKPKELGEFYRSLPEKVLENGDYDCRKEWDVLCMDAPEGGDYCAECPYGGRVQITRPPQSWCFVEA